MKMYIKKEEKKKFLNNWARTGTLEIFCFMQLRELSEGDTLHDIKASGERRHLSTYS